MKIFNFKYLSVFPLVLFMAVFLGLPLVQLVIMAFSDVTLRAGSFSVDFIGLENFRRMLGDDLFANSLRVTFFFTFGAVGLTLLFGTVLAIAVDGLTRHSAWIRNVLIWPAIVTPVVISVIWLLMLSPQIGVINKILEALSLEKQTWLGEQTPALLAVIAVAVVLLSGCIDADEAFSFVDGRLLALIFAMLAVGAALDHTGAIELIVGQVVPWLSDLPPWVLVWAVYYMTTILTELVSNNAIAVIMAPIAIALGHAMGVDPRPLVVAVMIAASACFATPIGYQTNMLVYGPGGYRFTDFLRIGIPLNLSLGVVVCLTIPLLWPL